MNTNTDTNRQQYSRPLCRYDNNCNNSKCSFFHQNEGLRKSQICKWNENCNISTCIFKHEKTMNPETQKKIKQEKGETIYKRIHPIFPDVAGKITGMILEANKEDEALADHKALRDLIKKSRQLLDEASQ